MSIPVLATKLYVPPPPPNAVRRPRLVERLNEGLRLGRKLTLISASAGSGKTTLVSAWVADSRRRVAWLSLDEADSDLARFLTYFIAALQTAAPDIGAEALRALQAPQPPASEAILTVLINEVAAVPDRFILVLDDYHLIDARPIDEALAFLIEHLPLPMHLVITTREDPRVPLARLRGRGQLTELRAADLRFTNSEAAEFLNQMMGLNLSADDVAALEQRTEGWIAGLQLAALSVQDQQDVPAFVRAFSGDHRYIVDYLVEEVLRRQPAAVRSFLLQTSILDRLSGPLCDAVIDNQEGTGLAEGSARLEALERGNLFVIPLDDRRQWYRYHHLFAEVLQAHLRAEQPALVATLHLRASQWFERNGWPADAIRHALAGQDFERAANLIEPAIPALRRSRQENIIRAWTQALPDEVLRRRPVLSVYYAAALVVSGQVAGVEERLQDAERWLDPRAGLSEPRDALAATVPAQAVVVDQDEFRRLPASIAIFRAALAQARGDAAGAMNYARRVLDLVGEDDYLLRGSAAGFLGLAYWTSGDLEVARRYWAECMANVQRVGFLSDAVGCAIALADICLAQGRLREAMSIYEQGLRLTTEQGTPLRGAADMVVGMSEVLCEWNDLDAARRRLQESQTLGEHAGMPQNPYRERAALARLRQAEGDLDGALDLLDEAERLYVSDYFPNVRPLAALQTRVWLAQNRVAEAVAWARARGLSAHDDLSYLHEFEYITLARVLLAQYQGEHAVGPLADAMVLLERLRQAAEAGERKGSLIEILVLQALAHQMQAAGPAGAPAALAALERALALAEPEGYVRIFVSEGPPMADLLKKAAARGIAPNYVGQLLSALGKVEATTTVRREAQQGAPLGLIEPLSERELEVLRLLTTELSGPEMADKLTVSLNTLRTHTKNIYDKLGVNSRRAAVRRAEELNLL